MAIFWNTGRTYTTPITRNEDKADTYVTTSWAVRCCTFGAGSAFLTWVTATAPWRGWWVPTLQQARCHIAGLDRMAQECQRSRFSEWQWGVRYACCFIYIHFQGSNHTTATERCHPLSRAASLPHDPGWAKSAPFDLHCFCTMQETKSISTIWACHYSLHHKMILLAYY